VEARSLQDPISFRTLAHVNGAARDALDFVGGQIVIELNAAQSNPLVLIDEEQVISVGNFEIQPFASALDFARIALAPVITSAAERAVKLLQAPLTGLPEGLGARPALAESALSEFGIAAQAFAAEARLLAQPGSFENVSTTQAEGPEGRMAEAPPAARVRPLEWGLTAALVEWRQPDDALEPVEVVGGDRRLVAGGSRAGRCHTAPTVPPPRGQVADRSAACAAFAPQAPWTPPPGCAAADAR